MAFQAKYAGRCAGCRQPINRGDWCDWDEGRPIHQGCQATAATRKMELQPGETVCTSCWLVKPCDCD